MPCLNFGYDQKYWKLLILFEASLSFHLSLFLQIFSSIFWFFLYKVFISHFFVFGKEFFNQLVLENSNPLSLSGENLDNFTFCCSSFSILYISWWERKELHCTIKINDFLFFGFGFLEIWFSFKGFIFSYFLFIYYWFSPFWIFCLMKLKNSWWSANENEGSQWIHSLHSKYERSFEIPSPMPRPLFFDLEFFEVVFISNFWD